MMAALYMAVIPFVNGFNFSALIIIPIIVSVLATAKSIFDRRFRKIRNFWFDQAFLIFLCFLMFSLVINAGEVSNKTLNHFFAILASFVFFYYTVERFCHKVSDRILLRGLWFGYVAVTTLGIVEFVIRFSTGFDLGTVIPRPRVFEYAPTFLGDIFRARSTFEESGHFAAYIMMSAPFLSYYHWHLRPSLTGKTAFVILSLTALFSAFSISAFLFGPAALFLAIGIKLIRYRRVRAWPLVLGAFLAIGVVLVVNSDEVVYEVFIRKFTGASYLDRSEKLNETLDLMGSAPALNFLFGYGPGSYFELGIAPAISVFINFFRDFGLVGSTVFAISILYTTISASRIKEPIGDAILVGCLLVAMYFTAIPNYFYPYFFVPFVFLKRASTGRKTNGSAA
jgi:hypothetical protein